MAKVSAEETRKRGAAILDILYRYTDGEQGLSIKELMDALENDYGISGTEKTTRDCCEALMGMGQLNRRVLKLNLPGGRVQWAAEPVFDDAELRLISDGLALSRVDTAEMRDIARKLQDLAGPSGRTVSHLKKMRLGGRVDASFLRNISEVSRAIQGKRPISCRYTHWNTDGKLVLNRDANGKPVTHVLDPYQLVYKNGHYYLVCRLHGQGESAPLSHWRADRLNNVEVLEDSKVAPAAKVLPGGDSFDVLTYMDERPYPFTGKTAHVTARTTSLDAVFDWFPAARVRELRKKENGRPVYEAEFDTVLEPTAWWALQYADCVEVMKPKALRDLIAKDVESLREKYGC